ncbi:MAG: hypothetical protein HY897_12150 [Deltaproteobacteria bacterium]|nr:hypothetical protein [Deltaproteobacteria bacterium]
MTTGQKQSTPCFRLSARASCLAPRTSRLAAGERGQAMAEYAIISFALLVSSITLGHFFLPVLMDAYQFYFDQFYFMLNLPIP